MPEKDVLRSKHPPSLTRGLLTDRQLCWSGSGERLPLVLAPGRPNVLVTAASQYVLSWYDGGGVGSVWFLRIRFQLEGVAVPRVLVTCPSVAPWSWGIWRAKGLMPIFFSF